MDKLTPKTVNKTNLLNPSQKKAMDDIFLSLASNKNAVLTGGAGTGKTFLVSAIIEEWYKKHKGLVYITAPTNKAVAVLQDKAQGFLPWYFKYSTIHKALNYIRVIDENTGETSFKSNPQAKTAPFKGASLRVVDESSMLDTDVFNNIKLSPNIPTIFVGDIKQLPPISEEISPVFTEGYPIFELTEIVRQEAGNSIIHLSNNLQYLGLEEDNLTQGKGYYYERDFELALKVVLEDIDNTRFLAWTNDSVTKFNKTIRQRLYGNPNKLELGELVVLAQPYGEYWTNYELKIEKLEVKEKNFFITKDLKISLFVYIINDEIYAIHESSEKEFYTLIKSLKKDAIDKKLTWIAYHNFLGSFMKFNYLYGITVHKSQGSTYTKTVIDVNDLNHNPNRKERTKLWYTAITRASDTVTLFKKPLYSTF